MRLTIASLLLLAVPGWPQGLTTDQKLADFQYLAAAFAKGYGPYEWKRDTLGVDALNITPWLDRVRRTTTDLQFYDLMSEYVSSLNDGHSGYFLPSSFAARLNFTVDIYDGKLLVDFINRTRLPAAEYPIVLGYELVSIDGEDAQRILDRFERYDIWGNKRATRRAGAALITGRLQVLMPNAPDVPEISTVVFRRPDGRLESYRIPWTRSGLPFVSVGRVPSFTGAEPVEGPELPEEGYEMLRRLAHSAAPDFKAVNNLGSVAPVFLGGFGVNFTRRLGGAAADPFYSGVIDAGQYKIGFLRIPTYNPGNPATASIAFQRELAFFQANTDGLIIDQMRNTGGSISYVNSLLAQLMTSRWQSIGFEMRATSSLIASFSSTVEFLRSFGVPEATIATYVQTRDELIAANAEQRGRTKPVSLDGLPLERDVLRDAQGRPTGFTKPLMVLSDEFSASASDLFAATIQDNARGLLFGWRTAGLGGSVTSVPMGTASQGSFSITQSLMTRKAPVAVDGFPASPYVENIGVHPDLAMDYMTRANLDQAGKPFVDAFTAAMVAHIDRSK